MRGHYMMGRWNPARHKRRHGRPFLAPFVLLDVLAVVVVGGLAVGRSIGRATTTVVVCFVRSVEEEGTRGAMTILPSPPEGRAGGGGGARSVLGAKHGFGDPNAGRTA